MLVLWESRIWDSPVNDRLEKGRKPTTNPAHTWHHLRDQTRMSHIGKRPELLLTCTLLKPVCTYLTIAKVLLLSIRTTLYLN